MQTIHANASPGQQQKDFRLRHPSSSKLSPWEIRRAATFSPQSWVAETPISLLGNPDQARCPLENGKGLVIFVVRRIRPMHC